MNAKFARFVMFAFFFSLLLPSSLLPANAAPLQQDGLTSDEPNNSFGRATPIVVGTSVEGNIMPAGDSDWYTLTVDRQGELQLSISNVAAELAISIRV
jgi:hypothetical protein